MKSMYVVILTLVMFSCQSNKDEVSELTNKVEIENLDVASDSTYEPEGNQVADKRDREQRSPSPANNVQAPADWTQKIIKTANISIELKDYHSFNNSVHHSLASYGAYIAQEQQQQDEAQ